MNRAKAIPDTITIHVPFRLVKRGGRKEMILPPDASAERPRSDNTLIKALARAFRWRNLIESGSYGTIDEIATAERINSSYVSRVLRMTLLAPDIVESILDGRQPDACAGDGAVSGGLGGTAGGFLRSIRLFPPGMETKRPDGIASVSFLAKGADRSRTLMHTFSPVDNKNRFGEFIDASRRGPSPNSTSRSSS
jgi:hypothetical protein